MEKITIYKNANYEDGVELGPGRYDDNRLSAWNLNKAISSVTVPSGMQVIMYDSPHWTGESLTLTSDTPWIGHTWNDRVMSLEVTSGITTPRVVVFDRPDYQGSSMLLEPGQTWWTDLKYGVGNDAIRSIQVPLGLLVVLFKDAPFKGDVRGVTSEIRDLSQLNFADKTSSIIVYDESMYESELRRGSPPSIPKLTSEDFTVLPNQTEQVLRAEALVPFSYVTDAQLVPNLQATQSPFYRLVKEEVWEMVSGYHHPGIVEYQYTKTVKTGMSQEQTNTVKKTLSAEITASGGLGFKIADFGIDLKLSAKVAEQLEISYSSTEKQMEERTVEIKYDFPAVEATVVLWMRKDIYSLRRWDDDPLVSWSFLHEDFTYGDRWPSTHLGGQPYMLIPEIIRIN